MSVSVTEMTSGGTHSTGAQAACPSERKAGLASNYVGQRTFTVESGSLSGPGFLKNTRGFVESPGR